MRKNAPKTTFGIELEFGLYDTDEHSCNYYWGEIERLLVQYNMTSRWMLVEDTSVSGDVGAELHTLGGHSITSLLKDYKILAPLLNKWQKAGILKINQSAGFHIHIGINDWSIDNLRHFYTAFQSSTREWLSFQPQSRTGNSMCERNTYTEVFDSLKHEGRYKAINTDSLVKHGTLELRLFAGTVRYFKVQNTLQLVNQYIKGVLTDTSKLKRKLVEVVDNKKLLTFVIARIKKCNKGNPALINRITYDLTRKLNADSVIPA